MSVLSYLTKLSGELVLSLDEKVSIACSLAFLKTNLNRRSYSSDIQEQAVFGSYDRETILPRRYDGGAGSNGASFIEAVLRLEPKSVRGVDLNENGPSELVRDVRATEGRYVPD